MGVSDSKGGSFSRDPVKFGEAGEVGGMVGVYHDHNLTIPRDRVTERRDSVVTISREFLDLYNRVTGDRRVRVRTPGMVTCSAYAVRSTIGPVALVGTNEGEVDVYELLSGSFFKAIRTVERGVPILSRKRIVVTALVCHPAMMDIDATGNDVAFAGHSDGSITSFKVMNGEMLKDFKAPAVEVIDTKGGVTTSSAHSEVASLACITQADTGRLVLCAGYTNGNLFAFDAASGDPLSHFRTTPNISKIMASSRHNMLLVTHDDQNEVLLWDLTTGNSLRFDFTHELTQLKKTGTKTTCAAFDDHRNVLFTGASNGSVFVRLLDVKSSLGASPHVAMKLLRFCSPNSDLATSASLTCMWYDSSLDRLYTGDISGVARVVKKVTGISFEATELGSDAVADGKYRARGDSISGGLESSRPSAPAAPAPAAGTSTPGTKWTLTWDGGSVDVFAQGGMVVPRYTSPDGSAVTPLFVAPWTKDADVSKLPPILRGLKGSYESIPFGTARAVSGLTSEWESCKSDDSEGPHGGYPANGTWELVSQTARGITIAYNYPGHHPIARVRKEVTASGRSVTVKCTIEARTATSVPVGASIIFALSSRSQSTRLVPGSFEYGSVFPGTVDPASRLTYTLSPGASFESLSALPRRVPAGPGSASGGDTPVNLSELPLPDTQLEAAVQLFGIDGTFSVVREDLNQTFTVSWDARVLPSAYVQVSNCGRRYYPWNGAHASVTVSPAASAFDLGAVVSAKDNPIKKRGYATTVDVSETAPFTYSYTISAAAGTAPGKAVTSPGKRDIFAVDDL